jgi:hypothetical protein
MQFCLLMSRFHVDFADGYACVWRGQIKQFHPKNVIQLNDYDGGGVMIWYEIGYYDKNRPRQSECNSKFAVLL